MEKVLDIFKTQEEINNENLEEVFEFIVRNPIGQDLFGEESKRLYNNAIQTIFEKKDYNTIKKHLHIIEKYIHSLKEVVAQCEKFDSEKRLQNSK